MLTHHSVYYFKAYNLCCNKRVWSSSNKRSIW